MLAGLVHWHTSVCLDGRKESTGSTPVNAGDKSLAVCCRDAHKQHRHKYSRRGGRCSSFSVSWGKKTDALFERCIYVFICQSFSLSRVQQPLASPSETPFPKASDDNSSCDEDSSCSLSPEQSVNQESPLGLLPLPSPPETLAGSSIPSPTQVGSLRREGDTL